MINAASGGPVGYGRTTSTSILKLLLFASLLLLVGNMTMFTFIELCEAAAIPSTNSNTSNDSNETNTEATTTTDQILGYTRDWRLITRAKWRARTPASIVNFTGPAPYVILHHSYQPGVCRTLYACMAAMRSMQNYQMDSHGWQDIGYSFAVGGVGNVYEGRGYEVVGAHAPNYNSRSIGLLLIGNFMDELPPAPILDVAQDFIKYSVESGYLREDYILHGHRQLCNMECPGNTLYAEIKMWPH